MAYWFDGCFAHYDPALLSALAARWPAARVREFAHPFRGIGLRLLSLYDAREPIVELIARFPAELLEFTHQFPDVTFVCVKVECAGGDCDHWGYAARNGVKLAEEEEADSDGLQRLLAHLDIKLLHGVSFAPFERTYPW
jgi:hypothetical protein